MAIIPARKMGRVFETDTIARLNTTGRHMLASGRTATVITDERFAEGDAVLLIKDDLGHWLIVGGKK